MTIEILLLAIMGGITLLAYLIAINAHGPFKISFSYFLATIMLAGTVWLIVQYVNQDMEVKKSEELSLLEMKRKAEEEAYKQKAELLVLQNKEYVNVAKKLLIFISSASNYASLILNVDLQNKSVDFNTLLGKASETKQKVDVLSAQCATMDSVQKIYPESYLLIKDGIKKLSEAVTNYKNFYYSEDSTEESQRERLLRGRAKDALDKFSKASALLSK